MKKYIDWVLYEEKPKTDVFLVFSRSSLESLGMIKWYAPWRQYVIGNIDASAVFNNVCLEDISKFLTQLNQEQKGS